MLAGLAGVSQASLQLIPGDKPVCVFGDAPNSISVTFSNSGDHDFKAEIHTRIFQTSSATAVQVSEAPWKELQVLPGQTIQESARLEFPAVKAETKFLTQWLENTNLIGTTEVWVYPTNLLAELKPLLDGETLGVLDPDNELKPLLKQNGVEFVDLGQQTTGDFSGRLAILGPFKSQAQLPDEVTKGCKTMVKNGAAILWMLPPSGPRAPLQPSFYTVSLGTNAIVVAQAGLLPNLADNPQSQLRLVRLCALALNPKPDVLPEFNTQP